MQRSNQPLGRSELLLSSHKLDNSQHTCITIKEHTELQTISILVHQDAIITCKELTASAKSSTIQRASRRRCLSHITRNPGRCLRSRRYTVLVATAIFVLVSDRISSNLRGKMNPTKVEWKLHLLYTLSTTAAYYALMIKSA